MKNTLLKYIFVPVSLFVFLFASSGQAPAAERVKAAELKAMLDRKENIVLIDVRTPEEHYEAHIPGSVLMPLDTLSGVTKLPEGARIIIYCRSGKRSLRALEILSSNGFKGLTDLEGGINAWTAIGGPVASGSPTR